MERTAANLRKRSLRDPSLKGPSLLRCRGWHALRRSDAARPEAKTWRPSVGTIAAVVVGVLGVAGAVYVMVRGLGLNDDLDFGAGAYYYADIPEYEKVLNWDVYSAQLPFWVYLVLFLGWVYLMWRLWKKIEKK